MAALLPVKPIRAGMLAFFSALAFIEVGAGAVVAEVWKLDRDSGSILPADRSQLAQILERLRVMEGVVAAGATATAILWSFVAVHNASRVGRNARRTAVLAMVAWVVAPVSLIVSRATDHGVHSPTVKVAMLMAQALVLYTPFAMMAKVTDTVGGPRVPFIRWYVMVAAAFTVHHVFTGALDLARPLPSDNFGRTAMLYLVNAVVVGLMAVMAAEASRGMHVATDERAWQNRLSQDDAHLRLRGGIATLDTDVPIAPPQPSVVPASMGPVSVPAPHPAPVLAPPLLAPPVSAQAPVVQVPVVQVPVVQAPVVQAPVVPARVVESVPEPEFVANVLVASAAPSLVSFPVLVSVGAAVTQTPSEMAAAVSEPSPSVPVVVPADAIRDAVSGLPSLKALMGNSPITPES